MLNGMEPKTLGNQDHGLNARILENFEIAEINQVFNARIFGDLAAQSFCTKVGCPIVSRNERQCARAWCHSSRRQY